MNWEPAPISPDKFAEAVMKLGGRARYHEMLVDGQAKRGILYAQHFVYVGPPRVRQIWFEHTAPAEALRASRLARMRPR